MANKPETEAPAIDAIPTPKKITVNGKPYELGAPRLSRMMIVEELAKLTARKPRTIVFTNPGEDAKTLEVGFSLRVVDGMTIQVT